MILLIFNNYLYIINFHKLIIYRNFYYFKTKIKPDTILNFNEIILKIRKIEKNFTSNKKLCRAKNTKSQPKFKKLSK